MQESFLCSPLADHPAFVCPISGWGAQNDQVNPFTIEHLSYLPKSEIRACFVVLVTITHDSATVAPTVLMPGVWILGRDGSLDCKL